MSNSSPKTHVNHLVEVDSVLPGAVSSTAVVSKSAYPRTSRATVYTSPYKQNSTSAQVVQEPRQLRYIRQRAADIVRARPRPASAAVTMNYTSPPRHYQYYDGGNRSSRREIQVKPTCFEDNMRETLEKSALLMRNTVLLREPAIYKLVYSHVNIVQASIVKVYIYI